METIYLQLYSLGQYGEQHPMKDNLKEVAAMGYDGVEFAGNNYGGMSADELKAELAANHLGCRSVHLSMDQIVPTLPFLKEIGCEYAIVAMHAFSDMEETLDCARQLNEAANLLLIEFFVLAQFSLKLLCRYPHPPCHLRLRIAAGMHPTI